jgi:rhodanese-related sulfurtransferase
MPGAVKEPFERIDVARAKQLIDAGKVTLIDVREPKEIPQDGKIVNSTLIPLNTLLAGARQHLKSDDVLFYCKVGARSAIACEMAAAVGLQHLYNLEGGIEAWKKQGLPVEYK